MEKLRMGSVRVRGGILGRRPGGQSLIEIAITLPVLLVVFMAIFDMGYYVFVRMGINHGIRAGLREAQMNSKTITKTAVKTMIKNGAVGVNLADTDIGIAAVDSDASLTGSPPTVTVSVTYTHNFIIGGMFGLSSSQILTSQKGVIASYEGTFTNYINVNP